MGQIRNSLTPKGVKVEDGVYTYSAMTSSSFYNFKVFDNGLFILITNEDDGTSQALTYDSDGKYNCGVLSYSFYKERFGEYSGGLMGNKKSGYAIRNS